MSVEQYGARLLGEVQEESLDELLKELRNTVNPTPNSLLGFPQLDELLELFRYHDRHSPSRHPEWTATSYAGVSSSGNGDDEYESTHTDHEARRQRQVKHRPAIIEVSSTKSAAGKTTLLYHLTALTLLPHEYGGKESAALWLDTDNEFSAGRIAQVMFQIITKASSKTAPSLVNDIITSALQHLYTINPISSASLLDSLKALPAYLRTNTYYTSPNRSLSLLVLDSATAFTYQDRFDADIARLEAGPNNDASHSNNSSRTSQILTALRQIHQDFESTIIFTSTQPPQKSRFKPVQRPGQQSVQAMPAETPSQSPWASFASLTIHISRIPTPQFAPNMTIEECLHDRGQRQEAILKGRFAVGLNWEGSEMWPAGVREVVGGLEGRGGFVVRITERGLEEE